MTTPIEHLSNLVVGTVESVSPSEVRVLLELDAPYATALNTGGGNTGSKTIRMLVACCCAMAGAATPPTGMYSKRLCKNWRIVWG